MTFQRRIQIRALAVLLLAGLAMLTTPQAAMANANCENRNCFQTCIDGVWELTCPDGQYAACFEFNYVCDEFDCPVLVVCDVE